MESVPATQIIRGVEYDLCSCCNKPVRGTGRKTGGAAIWVVKPFLRGGRRVEFSHDWARLCEAVGFRQTHWIKAWQVKEGETQKAFDGKDKKKRKQKKSFFRTLAEKRAAEKNYFASLTDEAQTQFKVQAEQQLWNEYNQLTPEQKIETNGKGKPVHPKPSKSTVQLRAEKLAFASSGEKQEDWNQDQRVDGEDILVFVKPSRRNSNET